MVYLRDIAAILGVSVSTVGKALKGYPDISEETRRRVIRTAEDIGYRADGDRDRRAHDWSCQKPGPERRTEQETERILYEVSPGPKPKYRCCIYKEREIVRGRVRLALGQSPDPAQPTQNVVAVIPAACDDCPIQDYFVSDICRFCLGKACLNSCKFGAITPGDSKMRIDPNKCKSCGMCA